MKVEPVVVATALACASCCAMGGTGGGAGGNAMGRSGPEAWIIEGHRYAISDTYVLSVPGGMQYTIEYAYVSSDGSPVPRTEIDALRVACPLIRDAFATGRYRTKDVTQVGRGRVVPDRIGEVIFEPSGVGASGFRIGVALSEIPMKWGPPLGVPPGSATPTPAR